MKKAASFALGCKVNQYESEAIAELFAEKEYEIVGIEDEADVYVINTCTVTNFGDKKSRQLIRKVKRQNPDAIVAVVGCYAQTAPQELMQVEGFGAVIAHSIAYYFRQEEHLQLLEDALRYLRIKAVEQEETGESPLNGLTFVVTGDLNHFANRKELQALIEKGGGKVTGSVTKKTNFLINNDVHSASSKNKKAAELGIPILSEDDFIERFLNK